MKSILYIATVVLAGLTFAARAQYHDAEAFEARGNVKTITVKTEKPFRTFSTTYSFLATGELAATSYGEPTDIRHDSNGRITEYRYNGSEGYYRFEYDNQGRLIRKYFPGGSSEYKYDQRGLVIQEIEDFFSVSYFDYEYLAFDDHDNWTKRTYINGDDETVVETRMIIYWPETAVRQELSASGRSGSTIVLSGSPVSGNGIRYIDDKYSDFLKYTLSGTRNTYTVIIGRTPISSLSQLGDVAYTDMRANKGQTYLLAVGTQDKQVSFHAYGPQNLVNYITYSIGSIPEVWKTRYGIDANIYSDPNRRRKLEALGFKFLSSSDASLFSYANEQYYVGDDTSSKLFILEFILDSDKKLSQVRISIGDEVNGNNPQLRDSAIGTSTDTSSSTESNGENSEGGGFLRHFKRLAQARAAKEEQARQLREQTQQRHDAEATAEQPSTASGTSSTPPHTTPTNQSAAQASGILSAWSMVDHPFGVLEQDITADDAIRQLSDNFGWLAELLNRTRIELSSDTGYDMVYDQRVPTASAQFSETDGRLLSYAYRFDFIHGKDCPEAAPLLLIRHMSTKFADLLAKELRAAGIELAEHEISQLRKEESHWRYSGIDRTVDLIVHYGLNSNYDVTLKITLR